MMHAALQGSANEMQKTGGFGEGVTQPTATLDAGPALQMVGS